MRARHARPGVGSRLLRRAGSGLVWVVEQVVEAIGELIAALLACLLLAGLLALLAWGYARAPRPTGLLLAGVVAVTLFGGWRAWRDPAASARGALVRLAVGWSVVVAVWLGYVLPYCPCG